MCFAPTAALQREGRALCETSREYVRLGRWCRTPGCRAQRSTRCAQGSANPNEHEWPFGGACAPAWACACPEGTCVGVCASALRASKKKCRCTRCTAVHTAEGRQWCPGAGKSTLTPGEHYPPPQFFTFSLQIPLSTDRGNDLFEINQGENSVGSYGILQDPT